MAANDQNSLVTAKLIAQSILVIRGQKVMIDADLAALYGVATKRLNELNRPGFRGGCLV